MVAWASFTSIGDNFDCEGPKGRPEGMNGSQFKFLAIEKNGLVPKNTPNPRVLGTVWSSYGGATPT